MPAEEIIRYALSFLGGGIISAVGNWVYLSWSARRAREVDLLREQNRLLYGPLFFFTSQNEALFKLAGHVNEVRREYFEGGNWSDEAQAQEVLGKQHIATIGLGNTYVKRVVRNNDKVMEILEKNWYLIEPADIEILSRFQVDYTRYLVEAKEQGTKGIPFQVIMKLGEIPFMHPDVMTCVREAFSRQRHRILKLTGVKADA
jgi:hypothetical protein